jgi:aspartyl/glutamyl-tRNA(Asn/Gln) amidotransferase C subunit
VEAWGPQLARVTDFFSQLRDIDVSNVDPALRAAGEDAVELRKDEAVEHPMAKGFLDTVSDREGDLIKVPKITTDADKKQ